MSLLNNKSVLIFGIIIIIIIFAKYQWFSEQLSLIFQFYYRVFSLLERVVSRQQSRHDNIHTKTFCLINFEWKTQKRKKKK